MCHLLAVIAILFGLTWSPQLAWSYNLEELPRVRVTLETNDPNVSWVDRALYYRIERHTTASTFISLNCTYHIEGSGSNSWHDIEVIYRRNGEPLGKFTMFGGFYGVYHEDLKWQNHEHLHRLNSISLNVYSNSSDDRPNKRSTSVWLQPLCARASGNYSCAVWLGTHAKHSEAKFISNLSPIRIEEIKT